MLPFKLLPGICGAAVDGIGLGTPPISIGPPPPGGINTGPPGGLNPAGGINTGPPGAVVPAPPVTEGLMIGVGVPPYCIRSLGGGTPLIIEKQMVF